jgi:hypothetical protein
MNACIYSGLRWLITSGIQDESGGVARYYLADDRRYRNTSTVNTGYYISARAQNQRERRERGI